jgi:uncharacterized protein YciI
MPWFAKIEQGIVNKATFDQHVPAHKAYVNRLTAAGHQARTGYWGDKRGGMMIFTAASLEEAQAIVEQDPLIAHACVKYELHEWIIV